MLAEAAQAAPIIRALARRIDRTRAVGADAQIEIGARRLATLERDGLAAEVGDVEACVSAVRLAMAYRERWGRDVGPGSE